MAKWMEELADRFQLPAEAFAGVPRITLTGNRHVWVENHRGLLSYTEELVEVNGGRLRIRIRGDGLTLTAMDPDSLIVTGIIFGVDTE